MYVIEAVPLTRGQHATAFSYFSKIPYERGAIVSIPVRSREVQAIAISCEPVSASKAALRRATFSLRRLPEQTDRECLSEAFLHTVDELSEYYAAQPGAVLFALLPKEIRNGNLPIKAHVHHAVPDWHENHEVLQATREARIASYKYIVRESFAQGRSVTLVVPTIEDGVSICTTLQSGVQEHTELLHSGLGIRALRRAYTHIRASEHPLLLITTPQHAFLGRTDSGVIILEHSRSFSYRGHTRPYIDFRHALTVYARHTSQRLITADTLVRAEDIHLLDTEHATPFDEHVPKRIELPGTLTVARIKSNTNGQQSFALFSKKLLKTIEQTRNNKGRTFLFSARRGLAPVVACMDCGHILRCPESGSPLALHHLTIDGVKQRWLISSVSGFRRIADNLCPDCGSWRLRERGIGIQQVYDELTEHFPKEDIFLFDHQTARTHKKATTIRDEFYRRKQTILLGTALALPYLHDPIEMSAIISMDSLRAIPSWRQEEEAFGILLSLREKTDGNVLVQTRSKDSAEDGIFEYAQKGSVADFYTEELGVRKKFKYPPFSTFIHLTWKDDTEHRLTEKIKSVLDIHGITVYTPPEHAGGTTYGLIRVRSNAWPEDDLVDALRALPPSVRIIINPDRLL